MAIDPASAARAYANAAGSATSNGGVQTVDKTASQTAGQKGFGDMVQDVLQDSVKTGQISETTSISAVAGKAGVVDVVTAVSNAELTLKTVVSVRDKAVDAYKQIMRMPI